ncbi:MAG: hypothetical protein RXO36_02395 [Candidatus Nanopusillus acidilobi]
MNEHSKQTLIQNSELITLHVQINQKELRDKLKNILLSYYTFETTLITLITKMYILHKKGIAQSDYDWLLEPEFVVIALYNNNSRQSRKLKYLENKYQYENLWQMLKETTKKINPHNLTYIIKRVEANFNLYIEQLKKYDLFTKKSKLPDPTELYKIYDYSVELDKQNSLSLARLENNLIGIKLSNGLVYININNKEQVKNLADINNIQSAKVVYNNGDLYVEIIQNHYYHMN